MAIMTSLDWSTIQWYNKSLVRKVLNHPICERSPGWHTRHVNREVPCHALQSILNWYTLFTKCGRWFKIKWDWKIQALCDVTLCCWVNDTPQGLLDPWRRQNYSHCNARNQTSDTASHPKNLNPWQHNSDSWKSCKLPVEPSGWTLRRTLSDMRSHSARCQLQFLLIWKDVKITVYKIKHPVNISLNIVKIIRWSGMQAAVMWPAWDEECNMKTNSGDRYTRMANMKLP